MAQIETMMNAPVLVIARLTLREAARRRLLIAVAILTPVLVALTAWGFSVLTSLPCRGGQPCSPLQAKALAATLLIFVMFMYSFVFTIGAVFVAAPAIAGEVDSGVALAMLTRPVRRSDVLIGRWLGLGVLVGGYTLATCWAEFLAVTVLVGYTPPNPILAGAFLFGESLVMLTLALLLSTRLPPMTGGIVALMLFGLAWIGGIARAVGVALESDPVRNIGVVTTLLLPTDGLWRGALFNLEPSILIEVVPPRVLAANPFFALEAPPTPYMLWALVWIGLILGLAVFSFNRREL